MLSYNKFPNVKLFKKKDYDLVSHSYSINLNNLTHYKGLDGPEALIFSISTRSIDINLFILSSKNTKINVDTINIPIFFI